MKKSLLAVAVLGAFAGAASAQSSVTLFGTIDLSANSTSSGGKTVKTLDSNQLSSNRLGFRGTEDLGGGLIAGFWLEAGMSNDTGAVGAGNGLTTRTDDLDAAGKRTGTSSTSLNQAFFNRRSTVSLTSKLGEIRLGRDYNPTFSNIAAFDVFGANGLAEGINLIDTRTSGVTTLVRSNNSIGYFLPSGLGGIYGAAQVAAQEGNVGVGTTGGNKYRGARLGYAAGPFDIAIAYAVTKTATSDDFKITNVGGSYDFGMAKVFGLYNKSQFGARTLKTYEASVAVPLGQGEFKASYTAADAAGAGTDGNNAKQYGVQYIYNLSKRTALYTGYSKIDNDGAANFSVNAGALAAAAGRESSGYNFGVKHSF